MFFTQDDYRRIEKWLQHRAVSDSELPMADPISSTDFIAIVQNGVNKKMPFCYLGYLEKDLLRPIIDRYLKEKGVVRDIGNIVNNTQYLEIPVIKIGTDGEDVINKIKIPTIEIQSGNYPGLISPTKYKQYNQAIKDIGNGANKGDSSSHGINFKGNYIESATSLKEAITNIDTETYNNSIEIEEVRNNIPQVVDTKIAEIVGAAPETLDTLEEIANKLHDNDDIHQSILAVIGEKVSNTTYTNHITQAERAMTAMNDKITELEGKLLVFESGAKLSLSISPSVIYKNTATNVTVTGKLNSSVELGDVALQLNGFAQIATGTNTVTKTESINDSNNTKTFTLKANVKGVQLTTSASLQLRNAIYCGFGSTANDVIKVLNRLSARTSASGIYGGTNTIGDNKHYIICVPNDIPALNNFTMGGAPYVMNHTTQTINEITYNIYTSGATYNNQTLVEIIAS